MKQKGKIIMFQQSSVEIRKNYYIACHELLAVVKTLEHSNKYFYGHKFYLKTDHAPLKFFLHFRIDYKIISMISGIRL